MPPTASKRGLCYPVENALDPSLHLHPFTRPGSHISWLYNWSPNPTPNSSLPFVAMQWSGVGAEEVPSKLKLKLKNSSGSSNPSRSKPPPPLPPRSGQNTGSGSSSFASASAPPPTLLTFNEPERSDQANMKPQHAASIWLTHIEPLRRTHGLRAGSPGISSCEEGIAWLQEFTRLIRAGGSDVDFWCLHWYGVGLGPFCDWIWAARSRLGEGKPVWITEFACTNWSVEQPLGKREVEEFLRESCKYLDSLDWVERYAWFGPMKDTGTVGRWAALVGPDGGVNHLGRIYRDA